MNKTYRILAFIGLFVLAVIALPLLLKAVFVSTAVIMAAIIIAGAFLFGIALTLALTAPLWIPFVAGYAAVRFCKQYYKKEPSEKQ